MRAFAEGTTRLLGASWEGDEAALAELVERHLPFVRQLVALRLGRRLAEMEDVEDLVQEAMLSLLASRRDIPVESAGRFRGWLARLVENRLRDRARHHGARKRGPERRNLRLGTETGLLGETFVPSKAPTPTQEAARAELEHRIESALLRLNERERRAILLRKLEDASYEEIAGELDLGKASSARSLVTRSLAKLSALLCSRSG